jgi:dihydrofolate reductase
MDHLTAIVAINHEGVIGTGNALPWRLKRDMQFFREQTMGNVVLMGRKTFDSMGRTCLPGRYNIIVTHQWGEVPEGDLCKAASGVEDALYRATLAPRLFRGAFVIGGATIYDQFGPFVDRYLITLVDKRVESGDTFFAPPFDERDWTKRLVYSHPADADNEAPFSTYELRAKDERTIAARRERAIAAGRLAAEGTPMARSVMVGNMPSSYRSARSIML